MRRILISTMLFAFLIAPNAQAGFKDWWPFSSFNKSTPPKYSQTQMGIVQELQDNITHTISQFVEYESIEMAAVSNLKQSDNYLACSNNSSESCSALITTLELRAENYVENHQKAWAALETTEADLMNQYAKLPMQIQARIQGQTLYYFQTAYLDRLKLAYSAIDEVAKLNEPEHCAQKNQDCGDFHLGIQAAKYQNLIDLHNSALQSLYSGKGEFMPDPKTLTSI